MSRRSPYRTQLHTITICGWRHHQLICGKPWYTTFCPINWWIFWLLPTEAQKTTHDFPKATRKRWRLGKGTQWKLWTSLVQDSSRHVLLLFVFPEWCLLFTRFYWRDASSSTLLHHELPDFLGPRIQVVQSETLLKGRYGVTIENCLCLMTSWVDSHRHVFLP